MTEEEHAEMSAKVREANCLSWGGEIYPTRSHVHQPPAPLNDPDQDGAG